MTDYRDEFYQMYGAATGHEGPPSEGEQKAAARQFAGRWRRWLPVDRSTPVLDIGCGPGLFVGYLRNAGFTNVTGIDRSATEVARAAKAGIAGVMHADAAEFLRDKNDAYGVISVFNVFEHLMKVEILALLRSLHRALRPGGRILAVTPNGLSPFAGTTRYWDFSHETSFTPAAWRQLALVTGFQSPAFEEFGPIPHSFGGMVRSGLWRVVALCIQALAYVEVGGPRDASRVYTADMKVILTR